MSIPQKELVKRVQSRANNRCEYCRMHQNLQGARFHVDHILPTSLGGTSDLRNLAWCCVSCNLHKSARQTFIDPTTARPVRLFNPRHQRWSEHFRWKGYFVFGITPTGRATEKALVLNSRRRRKIREAEAEFDLFPP